MPGTWTSEASFVDACVGLNRAVCVAIVDDELAAKHVPFTKGAVFYQGKWLDAGSLKWDAIAVTRCQTPIPQYAIVSVNGQVQFTGGGDMHEEQVQDGGASPPQNGMLRDARAIAGVLHVCGMNRQVYRREGRDQWRHLSLELAPTSGVFGFEAMDGFALDELYAVGWEGEIWSFDGARWRQHDAGTQAILLDVVCAGDGQVYAIGRGGKLIIGRGARWQTRDQELPHELCSLAWFRDRLYACSTSELYVWDGARFQVHAFEGDRPRTLQYLSVGESGLCAVGSKDLFLYDGAAWTRID